MQQLFYPAGGYDLFEEVEQQYKFTEAKDIVDERDINGCQGRDADDQVLHAGEQADHSQEDHEVLLPAAAEKNDDNRDYRQKDCQETERIRYTKTGLYHGCTGSEAGFP
jgi:hypothetical protein